jgi:hypothetical protein
LQTVFQALIKDERISQIQNRVLISGALDGRQLGREHALFLDLSQKRLELCVTEIPAVLLFPTEKTEDVGVLNDEDGISIGQRSVEQRIGKPARGGERFSVRQANRLLAVNNEE